MKTLKKLKSLLLMVLLLPIFPVFGADGGTGGTGGDGSGGTGGSGGDGSGGSGGDGAGGDGSGGGGEKTFTQAELDAQIKDRLAREKKKTDKMIADIKKQLEGDSTGGTGGTGGQGGQGDGTGGDQGAAATEAANKVLEAANQRLVLATATTEAVKLGVDPKYIAEAVKLADISKIVVGEDGTIDEKAVSKAIDDVLKKMPMLKQTQENQGGFRVGGDGGQGGSNAWGQNQNNNSGGNNNQQAAPKRWNRQNRY